MRTAQIHKDALSGFTMATCIEKLAEALHKHQVFFSSPCGDSGMFCLCKMQPCTPLGGLHLHVFAPPLLLGEGQSAC